MRLREVLIVPNTALGVVKLLQVLKNIGDDRVLDMRPLPSLHMHVASWPKEYHALANRRVGRRMSIRLSRQLGVET
jgi:hypothetical protein